jgi:uncharacterized RDD family membrane protein YckC
LIGVALINCKRCGKLVTSAAPKCPECSADPHTGEATSARSGVDRVRVCQGVGIRLAALLIDGVLLTAAWLLVGLVVYLVLVARGEFAGFHEPPSATPLWILFGVAAFVYFWWCEAAWGQTAGKRFLDLRVVRVDGARLGIGDALLRNLLRIIDLLPFLFLADADLPRIVDFLPFLGLADAVMVLVTRKRQRLGDLAARSVVVRRKTVSLCRLAETKLPVVPGSG